MRRAQLSGSTAGTALVLAALAACGGRGAPGTTAGDNVLLVVLDDLGVDGMGCYGSGGEASPTPNLDALAARGVRFENAWAAPVCSPTRAAIQTGRLGFRTGIGTIVGASSGFALPLEEVTLPELLDRGTGGRYAHAAFGKWHLGNHSVGGWAAPNEAGYDHFSGALLRGDEAYFRWPTIVDGERGVREGYLTRATVEDALAWIRETDGPWFCYLALHAPHAPLHAPPPELATVAGDPPTERARFEAMVRAADAMLGRLFDALGEELERTTVVVVGDNGTLASALPAPDLTRGKGTLYESGVRVPLVVAGPRVATPGVSTALVHVVDCFATVAEAAGVDVEEHLPGVRLDSRSLLPYLRDPDRPSERRHLYTELFRPNGLGPPEARSRAIRDARYKLIDGPRGEELYDLLEDPDERRNLGPAASDELRAVRDSLVAALPDPESGR